jgi:N utilization substance protein A
MLGRGIVLVREDQLSLAIGRRGQNVRLASKLSGWDIEIMTQDELAQAIDRAVAGFRSLTGVDQDLAERLVEEGFLSYDDLSIIEPDDLMTMGSLSEEAVTEIIAQAEGRAEVAEAAAAEARRQKREQERLSELAAEAGMTLVPAGEQEHASENSREEEPAGAVGEENEGNGHAVVEKGDVADIDAADVSEEAAPEDSTHEPTESAK